jgi:hypothetical protein
MMVGLIVRLIVGLIVSGIKEEVLGDGVVDNWGNGGCLFCLSLPGSCAQLHKDGVLAFFYFRRGGALCCCCPCGTHWDVESVRA